MLFQSQGNGVSGFPYDYFQDYSSHVVNIEKMCVNQRRIEAIEMQPVPKSFFGKKAGMANNSYNDVISAFVFGIL